MPFRLVRGVLDNQGIHQRDAVANGSRSVTHRHIHSERPLQKLLCGLPDWAVFTRALLSAARAMYSVASKAGAPQVDNIYSTSTDAICS